MRWRCLHTERGLHYTPTMSSKIINACVALHNICLQRDSDYYVEPPQLEQDIHTENAGAQNGDLFLRGTHNRQFIAEYLLLHAPPQG